MKREIKAYFEKLSPSQLGLSSKIKVKSANKLGMGKSNLNYLINANGKKFVFRMNIDSKDPTKSRKEFRILKTIEKHNIGPKARLLDDSMNEIKGKFIIMDYREGKSLDKFRYPHSKEVVRFLGKLCAQIHSIRGEDISKLRYARGDVNNYLDWIAYELKYINKHMQNNVFKKMLQNSFQQVKTKYSSIKHSNEKVFTQGDFCEQNIVYHKKRGYMIDFEDASLTSPTAEIARIFVDFGRGGLDESRRKVFLKEYYKLIKIKNKKRFESEIDSFQPFIMFAAFL